MPKATQPYAPQDQLESDLSSLAQLTWSDVIPVQFLEMTKSSWMSDAEILLWIEDFLLNSLYTAVSFTHASAAAERPPDP